MHKGERRLLLLLWACAVGTATAGAVVLAGDIVAGDWRYGSVLQLCGIAADIVALVVLIRVIQRTAHQAHIMEEANNEMLDGIARTDRAIEDFINWCSRAMLGRGVGDPAGRRQEPPPEGGNPAPHDQGSTGGGLP
jgi:hypothetical protein